MPIGEQLNTYHPWYSAKAIATSFQASPPNIVRDQQRRRARLCIGSLLRIRLLTTYPQPAVITLLLQYTVQQQVAFIAFIFVRFLSCGFSDLGMY
jgi:hypothetical protein